MVVLGLSAGRTETKELYSFLNSEDHISVSYESDLNNISWYDSENIIINPNGPINCKVTAVERLGNVSYIYSEGARGNTITIEQPKLTKIKTNIKLPKKPRKIFLVSKLKEK